MQVKHRIPAVAMTAFLMLAGAAMAQDPAKTLSCSSSGSSWDHQERDCAMREMTLPVTGALNVDGSPNGGISVKAWSRSEILVRARVDTYGDTKSQAESRQSEVVIATAGGKVSSTGPKTAGKTHYSVSYEIFVPRKIDLSLHSTNGGVSIEGVSGNISSDTTNGGLKLTNLAGKVVARTTNGGVKVVLAGPTWEGEGFEVSSTNGGVTIEAPSGYSAQVELSTTNGGLSSDFPITVQGKFTGKSVNAKIGNGGAPVKARTTNGGISLKSAGV
jgi:DUF4097 and DUF4098 domain-containing protein YvlB